MAKKKPLSKRAKALVAERRKDPGWRISMEVARFLETQGWRVVLTAGSEVRGFETQGLGKYEFVMRFSGGRIKQPEASDAVDPVGSRSTKRPRA